MTTCIFKGVYPIGDTNPAALPVKHIGPSIGYYTHILGFSLKSKAEKSAVLSRDGVSVGLVENDQDPDQASCYFEVSDVEALRRDFEAKAIDPSALRMDKHGEKSYRVFFARDPYGVCFCFGQAQ